MTMLTCGAGCADATKCPICSHTYANLPAMSDAPPPALGELARRATELDWLASAATAVIEALKVSAAEWDRRPHSERYEEAAKRVQQARSEFADACSPAVILQLVALASGGAAEQQQDQPHEGKTAKGQLESSATRDATVCVPAPPRCSHARDNLAYLHAFEDAEERARRGERQQQCPVCKLWLWPNEMGGAA